MGNSKGLDTLALSFNEARSKYANSACLSVLAPEKKGSPSSEKFIEMTYESVAQQAFRVARYLRSLGLSKGARVLLLGSNCTETVIAHIAVAVAGYVVVPPYAASSASEVQWQVRDSMPEVVIVENSRQLEKLGTLEGVPVRKILTFRSIARSKKPAGVDVIAWDSIVTDETLSGESPEWIEEITQDDDVLQLYTSSETGTPHGVIHTHGSLLANVRMLGGVEASHEFDRIALVLFLGHIYPLLMMWLTVTQGMTGVVPSVASDNAKIDVKGIMRCLRDGDASIGPLVPYFLHLMKTEVEKEYLDGVAVLLGVKRRWQPSEDVRHASSPVASLRFGALGSIGRSFRKDALITFAAASKEFLAKLAVTLAMASAIEKREAERVMARVVYPSGINPLPLAEGRPGLVHVLWRWIACPIVYLATGPVRRQIRASTFGLKMKRLIVGGSRLPNDLQTFWESLGLEVLQGYGTTQTGITHVQRMDGVRKVPETVGTPLDVTVKQEIAAETGELCLATPSMMRGYFGHSDSDKSLFSLRDGERWYCTGDTAEYAGDTEMLRITGRVAGDRMYNSLGGEKVYPTVVERKLLECPYIDEALVWGENQLFNVAIVVPRRDACGELARERGLSLDELFASEEFAGTVMQFVFDQVNGNVPGPSRIRSVLIAREPFTEELGFRHKDGTVDVHAVIKAHEPALYALFKRKLF